MFKAVSSLSLSYTVVLSPSVSTNLRSLFFNGLVCEVDSSKWRVMCVITSVYVCDTAKYQVDFKQAAEN